MRVGVWTHTHRRDLFSQFHFKKVSVSGILGGLATLCPFPICSALNGECFNDETVSRQSSAICSQICLPECHRLMPFNEARKVLSLGFRQFLIALCRVPCQFIHVLGPSVQAFQENFSILRRPFPAFSVKQHRICVYSTPTNLIPLFLLHPL